MLVAIIDSLLARIDCQVQRPLHATVIFRVYGYFMSPPLVPYVQRFTQQIIVWGGMHSIIYTSTAKPHICDSDIDDILLDSRARNHGVLMTGLLVFDGSRFLQYLEGSEHTVKRAYKSITKDTRHFDITTIAEGVTDFRQFPNWDMACTITQKHDMLARLVKTISRGNIMASAAELRSVAKLCDAA